MLTYAGVCVLMRVQAATEAVQALCDGNPAAAHQYLAALSAAITALAPSPLMSARMPGLIASLLKCCRPSLAPCVADALVLVHSRRPGREAELLAVTRKAVAEVHARMQVLSLLASLLLKQARCHAQIGG